MRRHGTLDLLLVLPDGSKSLIPAAWTDLEPRDEEGERLETLGSLRDLLHARTIVDALLGRLGDERVGSRHV
jgi:hypothetical protein